jgi:hypothetical protein
MYRIEKVFQLPKANNLYENIKIAVEGEDPLEALEDVYRILYMDRLMAITINSNDARFLANSIEQVPSDIDRSVNALDALGQITNLVKEKINRGN